MIKNRELKHTCPITLEFTVLKQDLAIFKIETWKDLPSEYQPGKQLFFGTHLVPVDVDNDLHEKPGHKNLLCLR